MNISSEEYTSESGHSLTYLAREGSAYRLLLYFQGILVFHKQYEYHQRYEAERERDALVELGHMRHVSPHVHPTPPHQKES